MNNRNLLTIICVLNIVLSIFAINHWVLSENGQILQKIDSPFYMREPNDLIAFLDQIKHNNVVETTYQELLQKREIMVQKMTHSIEFGMDVIKQAKCALDFYKHDNNLDNRRFSRKYLNRISLKKKRPSKYSEHPFCWQYCQIPSGPCSYDHLLSLRDNEKFRLQPEEEFKRIHFGMSTKNDVLNLIGGLEDNPSSWKYHTLSSYYWRMRGDGHEAFECAIRGAMLAPRKYRDIPLLSLGTILYRAEKIRDAEVILSAAVDHAPEVPENQFALGAALAMLNEFNKSLTHFNLAEELDKDFTTQTVHLKTFISCVENFKKKTAEMNNYVEVIKEEVNGLKIMKNKIKSSHEKIMQQQVPLGARYFDSQTSNEKLLQRGQYCSTRTLSDTKEPILFCDFYSDLQIRLESKEFDIEWLEIELKASSEAIIKELSTDLQAKFDFDKPKSKAVDS